LHEPAEELVMRWFLDDTRISALARDNGIAVSTAYDYRDEGVAVLAARQPTLRGALQAAKAAGHSHVILDGTLIHTDRISTPGPTAGVDLWWSGKHRHHGGNVQVVSAPDGWPLWTSDVRPGREHDMSAARADPDVLAQIANWVSDGALALADLGYEGEPETFRIPFKKPKAGSLSVDNNPTTRSMAHCVVWANAPTRCSRPPTRPCAGTAAARGASATSSQPRWSCSTTNTSAPHDQPKSVTQRHQELRGRAHYRAA
jgi:hypothetical protein